MELQEMLSLQLFVDCTGLTIRYKVRYFSLYMFSLSAGSDVVSEAP